MISAKRISPSVLYMLFAFTFWVYGQNEAPNWINESWRSSNYSSEFWYTGFSQNIVPAKADAAQYIKTAERDAQSKLAEGISVRISGVSSVETVSSQRTTQGNTQTVLNSDFKENFQAATNAELAKMSVRSYYDKRADKVYAFAAVRKSDLADYYAAKVKFLLDEAQRGIELCKQLFDLDKRKEALEKLQESKSFIDSAAYHRELLITIDTKNGASRSQSERTGELLKEMAVIKAEIDAANTAGVFVIGVQGMQSDAADIIVSALQTLVSENNVIVANDEKYARFVLKIDARICNQTDDGHLYFASACVKAVLTDVKTGRNEITANITGRKEGALSAQKVEEKAFKAAAADVWAKIKDKVLQD